jgi:proteic killer suppression protein
MIRSFTSKWLAQLWDTGRSAKIDANLHKRILIRLDRMNAAETLADFDQPGFDFHALRGFKPTRYTIHVNGPWTLTFAFDGTDVEAVDLEQYH